MELWEVCCCSTVMSQALVAMPIPTVVSVPWERSRDPPGEQVTLLFISCQLIMGVGQRCGQEVVMVVIAAGLWDQQAEGLLENLQQLLAP